MNPSNNCTNCTYKFRSSRTLSPPENAGTTTSEFYLTGSKISPYNGHIDTSNKPIELVLKEQNELREKCNELSARISNVELIAANDDTKNELNILKEVVQSELSNVLGALKDFQLKLEGHDKAYTRLLNLESKIKQIELHNPYTLTADKTTKLTEAYDPSIIAEEHTKLKTNTYDLRKDINAQKNMRDIVESLTTIVGELHEEVNKIKLSKPNKNVVEREHLDVSRVIDNGQEDNLQEGRYALADNTSSSDDKNILTYPDNVERGTSKVQSYGTCLLYTSDAADE